MTYPIRINLLKESFRGDVIQPGDSEYTKANKVYNAMIDKHPGVIARRADAADVMAAVDFGRPIFYT